MWKLEYLHTQLDIEKRRVNGVGVITVEEIALQKLTNSKAWGLRELPNESIKLATIDICISELLCIFSKCMKRKNYRDISI